MTKEEKMIVFLSNVLFEIAKDTNVQISYKEWGILENLADGHFTDFEEDKEKP